MPQQPVPVQPQQPGMLAQQQQPAPGQPLATMPIARGRGALGLLASVAGRGMLPPRTQPSGGYYHIIPVNAWVFSMNTELLQYFESPCSIIKLWKIIISVF